MGGTRRRWRALGAALVACGAPAGPPPLDPPEPADTSGAAGAPSEGESASSSDGPERSSGGAASAPTASEGSQGDPPAAPEPPPGAAPDASLAPEPAPGDAVFADGQVLDVRLTLLATDLLELDEHGDREEYVPAAARLTLAGAAPVALAEVGVRHKGNWTLHHCWDDFGGVRSHEGDCAKLSLKLELDKYAKDVRFDGLKRLNLHASMGDASRLRELLAYATFRAFGVDAPRAIPARVWINDEPRGLYIAVEDVDGRYTEAHFPAGPDGNLFKEIWPNAAFEDAELALALETNEELGDVSDMRALANAVALSTPETFEALVEPLLDVEGLARYIAVDRAIRNWDGVTAFYDPRTPHNFYWYHDSSESPRFHLIPWDMDDTYWPYDPYMAPEPPVTAAPIPNLNVRPAHCDPRPIWRADGSAGHMTPARCDKLVDALVTRHWSRVVELGHELLEGQLAPAAQSARLDAWAASVAPIVAEDPWLDPSGWESAVSALHGLLEGAAAGFHALLSEGLRDEPSEGPSPEE